MEKVDNLIEELDIELKNLEKLIDVIDDENSLIELRIRKKELMLAKLKIINGYKVD